MILTNPQLKKNHENNIDNNFYNAFSQNTACGIAPWRNTA